MIVYGMTSSNIIMPLLVDASGRPLVTFETPTTQRPTPVNQSNVEIALPAGTSTETVATVPTGQVWRMTFFTHRYVGTVAGVTLNSRVTIGSDVMPFLVTSPPVSGTVYSILINALLPAGATVSTQIQGATLNDDFHGVAYCERIE